MDVNLDDVDWAIIGQLQQDARISISELGRRVKLSASATTERVRHLEALGVITGYHAAVDLTKAGYPVLAVVRLKYPGNHHQPLRRLLEERHEILECLRTTGDDCYTLKVAATSMGQLETIMDELASFGSTTTSVVYSQTLPYRGPDRPLCIRLGPVRLRGSTGLASGKPGNDQRFTSHPDRGSCELVSVEEAVPPQDQEQQEPGKPTGRGFRPDIQGLRALAVGMVVIYHLYPSLLTGGFAGVDVFFVISGFLITGHLLRENHKTGKVALLDFWGRRAKRLVPAAGPVLTVTWVDSRLLLPATRLADTASQIRASALYFQNWQLAANAVNYLKSDSAASPVQHFWSLSVEEQFYLGWPLLFLLAALAALTARRTGRRRARGHHVALLLAAAVVAGSLWYSVYYTHANPAGAHFVTTTRIWELGLGGLLALLPAGLSRRIGRLGLLGWAGLGLVIASAFVLSGTNAFPGYLALLPAGGTAALILGGSAAGRFGPHRLTSARPMVFIGGISYSLYLWHWPLIVCYTARGGRAVGPVSGLAIVAAAVTLSWLTKVWVEDKVRTASLLSGHGWRSVSTALAAVVPVVLVSLYITAEPGPWNGRLGPDYPGAAALA